MKFCRSNLEKIPKVRVAKHWLAGGAQLKFNDARVGKKVFQRFLLDIARRYYENVATELIDVLRFWLFTCLAIGEEGILS